jgi:DNA-directed RNA polymerase subunit P
MDLDEEKEPAKKKAAEQEQAPPSSPVYECVSCGRRVEFSELERYISFRCPYCGYRIFHKVRTPIVKKVKAR